MRKTRRVDDSIEFFSVQRAEDSIARCDIAILVLDAEMGITEQDKKIADVIVENRKACIVVVNKWDLVAESVRQAREEEIGRRNRKDRREGQAGELSTLGEFGAWVQEKLFFLDYAPVIFTSAKSGFQSRPPARGRALRGRAIAAENSDGNFEPHVARRRRAPPAGQRGGTPAEIFLRDAGAAGAADISAVRQPRRTVFRRNTKNIWRTNCAARSVTKAARSCWCRSRGPRRLNRCGDKNRSKNENARRENCAEFYSPRRINHRCSTLTRNLR